MFTTVTVPAWALVLSALVCGFGLQKLGWMLAKWMLREGPWCETQCPICLRPHDSEARRLQRQLEKMHENYARLNVEHETLKKFVAAASSVGLSVIGGGAPVVNSGYDYLRLVVDHDAVAPDGARLRIPAGTRMYMPTPGVGDGYEQNGGVAARGEDATNTREGDAL